MAVTGADLKRLRERKGLTQAELADILGAALDKKYSSGSVSPWESGKRTIPADVAALVEELLIDAALPPLGDEPASPSPGSGSAGTGDTAPGGGPADAPGQPPLIAGGTYARACAELWEMIAMGVGMAGAAIGSQALMLDGAIIAADKDALGAAWGRLAETNDTFRKMLASMTEGGAWMQVALVTGTTLSRCYQNHAALALVPQEGFDGRSDHAEPAAA